MEKRTVDMKPQLKGDLKKSGLSDEMIADMAKTIDDGYATATTRITELDAQIAQLENDRAFWLEKQAGYATALSVAADVKVEEVSDVGSEASSAIKAETKGDGDKT